MVFARKLLSLATMFAVSSWGRCGGRLFLRLWWLGWTTVCVSEGFVHRVHTGCTPGTPSSRDIPTRKHTDGPWWTMMDRMVLGFLSVAYSNSTGVLTLDGPSGLSEALEFCGALQSIHRDLGGSTSHAREAGWMLEPVGTCWNLLEPVGTCWECERTWKSWDLEEVDQSFPEKAKETVVYVVTQFLALTNLIHSAIVEDLTLLSQFLSPAFYSFRTGCSAPIKAPFGFEWIFIAREVLQALQTSSAFSGVIAQLWQPSQVSYSLGTQDGKDSPKWRRAIFARNSWTTPPKPWFSGGSTHIWYRGMG